MVDKITNHVFEMLSSLSNRLFLKLSYASHGKTFRNKPCCAFAPPEYLADHKILKSETAGRNKQFSLNKENILTKYYLG